jgi:osmotically-inducible protein OsmY
MPAILLVLLLAGCISPAAVTRSPGAIGGRVTPAARAFARGARRLVRYAGQAADDAALAARVKAALAMHKGLEGCDIHVGAENNVISLTGAASSREQKILAAQVARETASVTGVVNCLSVAHRS